MSGHKYAKDRIQPPADGKIPEVLKKNEAVKKKRKNLLDKGKKITKGIQKKEDSINNQESDTGGV